ncbi:Gti1/Pac2 family-domain-containing protein [Mycena olivaceomarginata]|nr:Gti1/Pac2 family-domain-containing protein [Mycena olivaceomarginata]
MSFRPGINDPQPGPYVTHPALHIRDVVDAHKVLEAVRLNILPLIRRRLVPHERAQLKSGNVFVWEESEDSDEGGLVRWTEGRRWSQSRMRGDYLASKASDLTGNLPAPPKRKDRPSKVNGLTKQTYSVTVRMPGASSTRKWHIVAYFSACDYTRLPVVDNYDYLRSIRFDSTRGSHSPVSPTFELRSPGLAPRFHSQAPEFPLLLPPPLPTRREVNERVSLPPLASLGCHTPRPPLPHRHSTSTTQVRTRLSPEDRRILDSFRVVI